MVRGRKTKAEREQEWAEADHRVWEQFRPRLEALKSYREAELLVNNALPPDSPGRQYYANLGFFLQSFIVPGGSNYTEKVLYLQLIRRLDALGQLKPGVRQQCEQELVWSIVLSRIK